MNYITAILAGALQGLTEFLPISSTGHLIIFEKIFNISQEQFGLTFDASLHLGTLLAVILFFYKDYLKALTTQKSILLKLLLGTIPAVVAGVALEKAIETVFRQIEVVAISLIIFSFVMILAERIGQKTKDGQKINLLDSLIIGIFQALALIPGISRSGSTISAGLFLGLSRYSAAKFAFLLSGPIIAGAGLKKFLEISFSQVSSQDFSFFVIGIFSSAVFGYLTIKYFLKYLGTNSLYPFIIYRLLLGFALLIFL